MSEGKFTTGPWVVVEGDNFSKDIEITTSERLQTSRGSICEMDIYFTGSIGDEQKANAYLIAAAPEMYYEIERDIAWLNRMIVTHGDSHPMTVMFYQMKSDKQKLLAKARGEF